MNFLILFSNIFDNIITTMVEITSEIKTATKYLVYGKIFVTIYIDNVLIITQCII